jgi:hypothetical protein
MSGVQRATKGIAMSHEEMVALIRRRGVRERARAGRAWRAFPARPFVPEMQRLRPYGDYPLPIGQGQTISQPYIVALMTEALELDEGERVLELGTGSATRLPSSPRWGWTCTRWSASPRSTRRRGRVWTRRATSFMQARRDGYAAGRSLPPTMASSSRRPRPRSPTRFGATADGRAARSSPLSAARHQTLWKFIKHGDRIERVEHGRRRLRSVHPRVRSCE